MKLFKIFIPKQKMQTVTELESWTVNWAVKTGWADSRKRYTKVFIVEEEAKEYRKQLKSSAEFIGCWIEVELYKN